MSNFRSSSVLTTLSPYPSGSLRELIYLSAPIMCILFSVSIMGFCDRLFLAHDTLESFEGVVNASYLLQLFQICLTYCTTIAQVFVGHCVGAKMLKKAGPYIWQMIWFSLISNVLIFPLGYLSERLFFSGTSVQSAGSDYFFTLLPFIFLFPLSAALTSFYFGRGKVKMIMFLAIISNALNILLAPLFIFGIPHVFPHMGVIGAALATGICQSLFCGVIFVDFLSKKNKEIYGTGQMRLRWDLFWEILRIGGPRSISKLMIFTAWLACVHLMTIKGGDFLLTLTVTSSLSLLFTFVIDGMSQGVLTIVSYLAGKKDYLLINKFVKKTFVFVGVAALLVFIPCVLFPKALLSIFFTHSLTPYQIKLLVRCCFWLWVYFITYGLSTISSGLLISMGDTFFKMVFDIFSTWVLSYALVWYAMEVLHCEGDKLYMIMSFSVFSSSMIYFIRFKMRKWKTLVA